MMKIPNHNSNGRTHFTALFTLAILMVIGAALIPKIDVADSPRPRQGSTLTISFSWHGTSAKVIEQNVTSRIEGLVAAVGGVEKVSSESYFGSGRIVVQLKKKADVSAVKFEIGSLLKQVRKKLPEGVSYPVVEGGDVVNEQRRKETTALLLTYQVNSSLSDEQIKDYLMRTVEPELRRHPDVRHVEITGGRSKYIEITYNPFILASYGLSASDIEKAIRSFMGRSDIIGEVLAADTNGNQEKMALYLQTGRFTKNLEEMPIGTVDGKTVFLNDLATYEYKDRQPGSYYRVNGLGTIYLNIHVDAESNVIKTSSALRAKMDEIGRGLKDGVYLTLTYDKAQEKESELHKLVWRSLMSLVILFLFLWLVRRDWRYLFIMLTTLTANLLAAVIAYWMFDVRLHIYSLAGITVSLGLIIDSSVVMVDHYGYYRNRRMFLAILAALLTTIGSLVVVFWLPDYLQHDLRDFALIVIINLSVALAVAYFFVPALIESLHYESRQKGHIRHERFLLWWKRSYTRYVGFVQKRRWIYIILLVMAFGIPFHLLPAKWGDSNPYSWNVDGNEEEEKWYATLYNSTLGSTFFQQTCKEPLSKVFGGAMRLFTESLSENTFSRDKESDIQLHIRAQMPLGGTAAQLNEKVLILDHFLAGFKEIERFETRVERWGATVDVKFKEEFKNTSFPYLLENKVIGKVITIGGADWSTSGVSERGFSNSLNLQYRSNRIEIAGYNYDRLYRIAEDMCREMRKNSRVTDLIIETPGHERQEDEFYMEYNKERVALYGFDIPAAHRALKEILSGYDIDRYEDRNISAPIHLKSRGQEDFDLWMLKNAYLHVAGSDTRLTDFMEVQRREAKNCIPKVNQEYVLRVAFNILGSYTYSHRYIRQITEKFNAGMPVGFRCLNKSFGYYHDDGTQYWLIGLIAIIIFFICSILFESLYDAFTIVLLIPVSLIGTFLTYSFSGVEFGTGGYASMVMLAGLTVNAGIYIQHEYRSLSGAHPTLSPLKAYVRAYNHKIIAVFLTVLSTVLGLVPFYIDGDSEPFWFSFAVGSTGGLLFSIIALVFVMPIFMRLRPHQSKSGHDKTKNTKF